MPRDADRLDRLAVAPLSAFCPSSSPSSSYSSARTLLIFEHCVTKPRLQRRGNADKKKETLAASPDSLNHRSFFRYTEELDIAQ